MLKRIRLWYQHFVFGVATVVMGVYTVLHAGYIDSPQVTPPPPPPYYEQVATRFSDDAWFGFVLIAIGTILICGVLLNHSWLRKIGLALLALPYGALFFAYGTRGLLDFRINLTWIFIALAVALLIGVARKGDYRGR
ncbi:hypothetical protein GPK34_00675 [Secundilactobacillus kimchicus]|uniref:hypothetical protein n=1 Tax=Secundilactobacillus kimchicus TaxID=528209 RepID=UPI001C030AD6|nr:hypothetical protein [Secundilactobacillus kimchicus]MBT9670552.1 hypothetical protein [Secundilactobacillus kimchicus]